MMMPFKNLYNPCRVLCRLDLDVSNDGLTSLYLQKSKSTLKSLIASGHSVLIVSHKGMPDISCPSAHDSLESLTESLSQVCGSSVRFARDWPQKTSSLNRGEVVLAENTRLLSGELHCQTDLVSSMLSGIDAIVYDALSVAHLHHASTYGITQANLPVYSGVALESEIAAFTPSQYQGHGCGLVLGGASPHTKMSLIPALSERFDWVMISGMMLASFVRALNGKCESNDDYVAQLLLQHRNVHLPIDVRMVDGSCVPLAEVRNPDGICDIGPQTIFWWGDIIRQSMHVMWYGPLGFHEHTHGKQGSVSLMQYLRQSSCVSMILGADTVALFQRSGYLETVDQYSFAGEAMLHVMLDQPMAILSGSLYEEAH